MPPFLSPRLKEALYFAAEKHNGQYRKGDRKIPYLVHPVLVAFGVSEYTDDEDIVIAALLHDVVEDCNVSSSKLADMFGKRVATIVDEVSAPKHERNTAWRKRKQYFLDKIADVSREAMIVAGVDKMTNMKAYFEALDKYGEKKISKYFGGSPEEYVWYYRQFGNIMRDTLQEHKIVCDYFSILEYSVKRNKPGSAGL